MVVKTKKSLLSPASALNETSIRLKRREVWSKVSLFDAEHQIREMYPAGALYHKLPSEVNMT